MICGNSFMISDIYDILVNDKKINPNQIFTESFFNENCYILSTHS